MNRFFRGLIAAYGAKKLGGGCFSTILIFIIIYYLLGTCNRNDGRRSSFIEKPTHGHVILLKPYEPLEKKILLWA